jgi:hypothetical protein
MFFVFSNLQLQNFHAYSLCFKSPFICLKHFKERMWAHVFFVAKDFFIVKCAPKLFIYLLIFHILHKRGSMCSNHSKISYTWVCLNSNT